MIGFVGVVNGSSFDFALPKSLSGDGPSEADERLSAFNVRSLAIPMRVRGELGIDASEKSELRRSGAEEEEDVEFEHK